MGASWDGRVLNTFMGHCDLDLFFRIIVSGAYLLIVWSKNLKFGVSLRLGTA